MNKYEMLYILNPDLTDEAKENVIKKVEDTIVANNGTVVSIEKWAAKSSSIRFSSKTKDTMF